MAENLERLVNHAVMSASHGVDRLRQIPVDSGCPCEQGAHPFGGPFAFPFPPSLPKYRLETPQEAQDRVDKKIVKSMKRYIARGAKCISMKFQRVEGQKQDESKFLMPLCSYLDVPVMAPQVINALCNGLYVTVVGSREVGVVVDALKHSFPDMASRLEWAEEGDNPAELSLANSIRRGVNMAKRKHGLDEKGFFYFIPLDVPMFYDIGGLLNDPDTKTHDCVMDLNAREVVFKLYPEIFPRNYYFGINSETRFGRERVTWKEPNAVGFSACLDFSMLDELYNRRQQGEAGVAVLFSLFYNNIKEDLGNYNSIKEQALMELLEPRLSDADRYEIEMITAAHNKVISKRDKENRIHLIYEACFAAMTVEEAAKLDIEAESYAAERFEEIRRRGLGRLAKLGYTFLGNMWEEAVSLLKLRKFSVTQEFFEALGYYAFNAPLKVKATHEDPFRIKDIDAWHDLWYYWRVFEEAKERHESPDFAVLNMHPYGKQILAFNETMQKVKSKIGVLRDFREYANSRFDSFRKHYGCEHTQRPFDEAGKLVAPLALGEEIESSVDTLESMLYSNQNPRPSA